nr:hypothetical protein [uncultured Faecalibacillus sp.]
MAYILMKEYFIEIKKVINFASNDSLLTFEKYNTFVYNLCYQFNLSKILPNR